MTRLADAEEPIVPIPPVLTMVEVHVEAVVVGIDVGHVVIVELAVILYKRSSRTPPVEYSSD